MNDTSTWWSAQLRYPGERMQETFEFRAGARVEAARVVEQAYPGAQVLSLTPIAGPSAWNTAAQARSPAVGGKE